ncbi:MAG: pyridoxamine 5'-phosphate oxidase family protein [Burkholderiales bacterium]|nr:pyridoxamine 5'-phosphate oxidase family protein [Burkholderiales bacterium]
MSDRSQTTDIAFTPAVRAMQQRLGTRDRMEAMAQRRGFQTEITPDLAAFIAARDSVFLATATAEGQPYIQHRGGEPGFLAVVDDHTLRFDDLPGNSQYLTLGNLSENDRVHVFLIDYETRIRIKIWGKARILNAEGHRQIEIVVAAWDRNCAKHLPSLYAAGTMSRVTEQLTGRIAELEAALARCEAHRSACPPSRD